MGRNGVRSQIDSCLTLPKGGMGSGAKSTVGAEWGQWGRNGVMGAEWGQEPNRQLSDSTCRCNEWVRRWPEAQPVPRLTPEAGEARGPGDLTRTRPARPAASPPGPSPAGLPSMRSVLPGPRLVDESVRYEPDRAGRCGGWAGAGARYERRGPTGGRSSLAERHRSRSERRRRAHAGISCRGSTWYQAFTRSIISRTAAGSSGWNVPAWWNRSVAPFASICGSATHA